MRTFFVVTYLMALVACVVSRADSREDYRVIPKSEPKTAREARRHGYSVARQVESELAEGDLLSVAKRTDWTLDVVVDRAISELRRRGHQDLADEAAADWNFRYRGFLTQMVLSRSIGDHKPLIQWLATFYDTVEIMLGVEVCKSLHLSDIKSLNHGIPVVFRPCSFEMDLVTIPRKDEYRKHFNADEVYYGFLPVIVYWAIDIPCMIGTAGLAALLCGPAASVGEYATYKWIGPKVSDRIFDRACN